MRRRKTWNLHSAEEGKKSGAESNAMLAPLATLMLTLPFLRSRVNEPKAGKQAGLTYFSPLPVSPRERGICGRGRGSIRTPGHLHFLKVLQTVWEPRFAVGARNGCRSRLSRWRKVGLKLHFFSGKNIVRRQASFSVCKKTSNANSKLWR